MKKKRLLGSVFILISAIISLSISSITGAFTGINTSILLGLIATLFFIVGIVLIVSESRLENLAQKVLQSRTIITDPKKLKKIATRMGYEGRNVKEGYQILDKERKPLTVIPSHKISSGVYRSIIKSLATGKSNFRKYSHA